MLCRSGEQDDREVDDIIHHQIRYGPRTLEETSITLYVNLRLQIALFYLLGFLFCSSLESLLPLLLLSLLLLLSFELCLRRPSFHLSLPRNFSLPLFLIIMGMLLLSICKPTRLSLPPRELFSKFHNI